MCFIKSSGISNAQSAIQEQSAVVRHEADASATKNQEYKKQQGYEQNLKTSAIGLQDEAKTGKKTLLGE